jgi:hypothetical protein
MDGNLKQYILSEEAINQVLAYLATRPFQEVFQIIPKLQLPNIEEVKSEEKDK